jgi:hypothetical protein
VSLSPGPRKHHVKVSLNDQELARLDELRGDEERAVYLRRLLHEPPTGAEVATHTEALTILTRLARDGRTTAAIALERALRGTQPSSELEEFLRGTG